MSSALASPLSFASRSLSRLGLIVCALVLPVIGVRMGTVAYADRLASGIAAGVSLMVLPASQAELEADLRDEPVDDRVVVAALSQRSAALGVDVRRTSSPARARATSVRQGIRISSAQVLALAARRVMPQAVPVKGNGEHPPGLSLRGVSALGVGLQDGDVLTEAAGQRASSVAAVVGIVISARGRQVPEISGKFYRAGVPFGLTVEQPYPKRTDPG